ncbi:sortase domain-containing protein [Streptomyces naganishii]|uniref:Class F sortase n=1 Tax=Streptomyces naganishii JCM 4654 TaxID=1306179 RepID=A0A919CVN3_9ACTN|nr:sortase [Streptomyces naganishii]GHD89445.1 class F sortase [Streptomyces naganishii JCM 4654]
MSGGERSRATARLLTGLAWTVLLLGLWLWGRDLTDVRQALSSPATGDIAAVGRPAGDRLPPAAHPLKDALPRLVEVPALGVRAPVVARAADAEGRLAPPAEPAGAVGWYGAGVKPGAPGTALLIGQARTGARGAVFRELGTLGTGATVRVARGDGTAADFTVDRVDRAGHTGPSGPAESARARLAPSERHPDRAELLLVTYGGATDVVVHAYLTGTGS